MNDQISTIELLMGLPDDVEWNPAGPGRKSALAEVEEHFRVTFPEDYRELMLYTNGCELIGKRAKLNLDRIELLIELSTDPEWLPYLDGMVVFGGNEGGDIYFMDIYDRLGRGTAAIFSVGMGTLILSAAVYAAPDITHLFQRVIAGEDPTDGPALEDEE